MKYFTRQWWEGKGKDPLVANDRYCRYVNSVRKRLPKDLWRLYWDFSLHDATLRRVHFTNRTLELCLDGEPKTKSKLQPGLRHFRLTYRGVASITSLASKSGLPGPRGYGDLGYDEIEVIRDGLYEHRMLFSSWIELRVRFSDFELWHEDKGLSKRGLAPAS